MANPCLIAIVGDAADITTFGGFPYHLISAAQKLGLPYSGLDLSDRSLQNVRKLLWNAKQFICGRGYGGYQYSTLALQRRWKSAQLNMSGSNVISIFQLYPSFVFDFNDVKKWFYIDATLKQLFEVFNDCSSAGRRYVADILARERNGYNAAEGVICHSTWAARSVILDYGVDARKVHVVVPGANFDERLYATWMAERRDRSARRSDDDDPLRLVFVGRDWERKGLDRLLGAGNLAIAAGARLNLTVVGCRESDLPERFHGLRWVNWLGAVSKAEPNRFFDIIGDAEIGCLLSRKECGGISLREFCALGLGLLAPNVCGSPDHCPPGAAILTGATESDQAIADTLVRLAKDPALVSNMRAASRLHAASVLWTESITKIESIISSV